MTRKPSFRRHKIAVSSGVFLLLLTGAAVFAPLLAPIDPLALSTDILQPPSAAHLLGTDDLGRDVLSQMLYGARVSLLIGVAAALATTLLGTLIGGIAGYWGGWLDASLMRLAEFFQVMPTFILAVLIVALAGPGLMRVIAVVAALSWPQTARIARGEVLRLSRLEFVEGLRCLAVPEWRILLLEVLPNAIGPVVALGSLVVGSAILLEASLSFLGLADPSGVSWGRLLSAGQRFLFQAWWLSAFPGAAIFVTVLAFNLLADALRDILDPRHAG
jgi:peptide/nickel transport system permease protein